VVLWTIPCEEASIAVVASSIKRQPTLNTIASRDNNSELLEQVPTEPIDVRAGASEHAPALDPTHTSSRRRDPVSVTLGLAGLVFALDLLWSLTEVSTGSLAYGLVAEPAHLATCAIALLAVVQVRASQLPARFVTAALIASIAIDFDHIPRYLGSHFLAGNLPRPYPHSVLLMAALVTLGLASGRRGVREVSFGGAFGVSAHLFRDLATGPGVPLVWPVSSGVIALPYAVFAAALALAVLMTAVARRSAPAPGPSGVAAVVAATPREGARRGITRSCSDRRKR
jgi:inner membrane protein